MRTNLVIELNEIWPDINEPNLLNRHTHTSQIDQESIWARLFDQKYDHIKINNELMPIEHVYVYMFSFAVLFAVCVCVCVLVSQRA